MSEHRADGGGAGARGSWVARTIRLLWAPILLVWVAVAVLTNIFVPQLEVIGAARSVAMNAPDSPSISAMRHIGKVFHQFDSDSAAMVVLEGRQPLGADAHAFYDALVKKMSLDTKHVEHVQASGATR